MLKSFISKQFHFSFTVRKNYCHLCNFSCATGPTIGKNGLCSRARNGYMLNYSRLLVRNAANPIFFVYA